MLTFLELFNISFLPKILKNILNMLLYNHWSKDYSSITFHVASVIFAMHYCPLSSWCLSVFCWSRDSWIIEVMFANILWITSIFVWTSSFSFPNLLASQDLDCTLFVASEGFFVYKCPSSSSTSFSSFCICLAALSILWGTYLIISYSTRSLLDSVGTDSSHLCCFFYFCVGSSSPLT